MIGSKAIMICSIRCFFRFWNEHTMNQNWNTLSFIAKKTRNTRTSLGNQNSLAEYETTKKGGPYIWGFSLLGNKNCHFLWSHNFVPRGPRTLLGVWKDISGTQRTHLEFFFSETYFLALQGPKQCRQKFLRFFKGRLQAKRAKLGGGQKNYFFIGNKTLVHYLKHSTSFLLILSFV